MSEKLPKADFVESLARGLSVIRAFSDTHPEMSLSTVAAKTELARPTARRILLTLQELGYVREHDRLFSLTPRVLELGMAYIGALDLWSIARPHLEWLVGQTGESSSMAQLDGSDIVYIARVAVPKIIALRVDVGTKFPAWLTSQGKVLLASMPDDKVLEVLREPSRSGLAHTAPKNTGPFLESLALVRDQGWALADNELAPGVRSVAVAVKDGHGIVRSSMNVTVHAQETSTEKLINEYLPLLQTAAQRITGEWTLHQSRPTEAHD